MAGIMNKPHRAQPKFEVTIPAGPNSSARTFRYDVQQRGGPGHAMTIGNDFCPACPNCRKLLRVYGANNESKKVLGEIQRGIGWEQITRSVWLCDECKTDPYARQSVSDGSVLAPSRPSLAQMYPGVMPAYPPPGYPPPGYPPQAGYPPPQPGFPPQPVPGAFASPPAPPMQFAPPQAPQQAPAPQMHAAPPAPRPAAQVGQPQGTAFHASVHAPPRPHVQPAPGPQSQPPPDPQQYAPQPPPQYAPPPQAAYPAAPAAQAPPPSPRAHAAQSRPQRQRVADWRTHGSSSAPQTAPQPMPQYAPDQDYGAPPQQFAPPNGHTQADYERAMAIANGTVGAPQTALAPPAPMAPLPPGPGEYAEETPLGAMPMGPYPSQEPPPQ